MSNDFLHIFLMVCTMAVVTYLIRAFPFLVFSKHNKIPPLVEYLGEVVSPAAIAMLVIYCFKDVNFFGEKHGIPEIIASFVVVALHLKWKNPLLSICLGTATYMVLIQNF